MQSKIKMGESSRDSKSRVMKKDDLWPVNDKRVMRRDPHTDRVRG